MRQQLASIGLALIILVAGLGLVVIATERAAGALVDDPPLLTASDVATALGEQDVVVNDEWLPTHHPLLEVSGTQLTAADSTIEVFAYRSVADEQRLQRYVMQLQGLTDDSGQLIHVTSARNVLLLFRAESAGHAASIHEAARSLAATAAR
jgi:hypothetical protein